ncbi:hypothetical protein ABT052_30690 [Streptomyces sp. NPDC002766]|jgi:hypothetical protein|uniref:hypothetical protein n=1 Tax=unclassified Streptomyces TaxID=2593676 RepID=UPI0033295A7B
MTTTREKPRKYSDRTVEYVGERSGELDQDGGETFTGRINYLFSVTGTQDAERRWRNFSTGEVADMISRAEDRYQVKVSRSYLGMLRSGRYTNPSIAVVVALVRFFNDHLREGHPEISVDWLASGSSRARNSPDGAGDLSPLTDQQVRHIAMRAGKMTPDLRKQLIAILDMMDGKK